MRTRLKRRIFFSSTAQERLQENDALSMVKQLIRFSFHVFCVRSCSKDFYKIAQSFFVNSEEVELKDNYIPRRHAAPGEDISGSLNDKVHNDLFVATTGFCDKFLKNFDNSDPENRFFRPDDRLSFCCNIWVL